MAAFKCFFCAKVAQCSDHVEGCSEFKERQKKISRKAGKVEVTFK